MSLFKSVLLGLQKKIDAQTAYKEVVIQSIQDVIHINIASDAILSLREGVLSLQTPPTIKMSIMLKQDEIIENLKKRGVVVSKIK